MFPYEVRLEGYVSGSAEAHAEGLGNLLGDTSDVIEESGTLAVRVQEAFEAKLEPTPNGTRFGIVIGDIVTYADVIREYLDENGASYERHVAIELNGNVTDLLGNETSNS